MEKLIPQETRKLKSSKTMRVVRRSDTELALHSSSPQDTRTLSLFTAALIVAGIGFYVFLRLSDIGSVVSSTCAVLLGSFSLALVAVAVLLVLVTFTFSSQNPAESCVLDKKTGYATVVTRVIWRLFRLVVANYRLSDIVAVSLGRSEYNLRLDLELKPGEKVKLLDEPASLSHAAEIGEQISDFLNIPLSIDMGGRTPIETYPGLEREQADEPPE